MLTAESTGDMPSQASVVAPQTGTPPAEVVSPAQSQPSFSSNAGLSLADAITKIVQQEAMIANQDQRIRALMSDKDKAENARNKAITDYTNLFGEYSTFKEQTQSSITSAANAAQQSIDRQKQLEIQMAELQGNAIRANALLERPHLAAYAQFIPASSDAEKVKAALDQLEQIRQQDLVRAQAGQPYSATTPTQPGLPSQQQQVQNPVEPNLLSLYAGRNLPFAAMPGSSPAQMSPAGTSPNTPASIQQLFDDAKNSNDPNAFEQARQQAILLANSTINKQLGRSS
jgi:hypothetical protein